MCAQSTHRGKNRLSQDDFMSGNLFLLSFPYPGENHVYLSSWNLVLLDTKLKKQNKTQLVEI